MYKSIYDPIYEIIQSKKNTEWHDDPFFIVNLNAIECKYKEWITKLPDIKPFYAIKCNPDLQIIQKLSDLGCNFDCASKEEIKIILNITNSVSRIIFANPCKAISHIEYAERQNVSLIVFDSVEELIKIATHYPNANVILRLAVDDSKSLCQFNSKFGCKEDSLANILKNAKTLGMNLIGFSFHVGSGCSDAECYYTAIQNCRVAYNAAMQFDFDISIIDIGGGFTGTGKLVSFDDIVEKINKAKYDFFDDIKEKINFIAEPGRFFTEESQILVVNVTSKKNENGVIKYYLNDGIYGSFNCTHFDHQTPEIYELKNSNSRTDSLKFNSTFFGPTCDSMDVIYKNIMYTELDVGDWLYVKNFGSYTNAPGATFNGFKTTDIRYVYL